MLSITKGETSVAEDALRARPTDEDAVKDEQIATLERDAGSTTCAAGRDARGARNGSPPDERF